MKKDEGKDLIFVDLLYKDPLPSASTSSFLGFLLFSRVFNPITCASIVDQQKAGIREVHFLPFSPTDKRTTLIYFDSESKMHRVSKGAPEQEVPEGRKVSAGDPW